jgi:hypothetical protein
LMGWEDDAWKTARDVTENRELAMLRGWEAGQRAATVEPAKPQAS